MYEPFSGAGCVIDSEILFCGRAFRQGVSFDIRRNPQPTPRRSRSLMRGARSVAIPVLNFEVDDYDAWKPGFDEDAAGRGESGAIGYVVSRAVDNPNEVFIRVDFPSVDQAKAFRERLLASGAIERGGMRMKAGPTVAEIDDATTY